MNNTENKKNTHLWRIAELCIVVIALIWYIVYDREKNLKNPILSSEPLAIEAMTIKPQDIVVDTPYIGFVTPINDVAITSYINGYIEEIKVSGGQEVKKNDILVVIRQDEYKAQLDLSNAKVMQAQANFDNASSYYDRILKAGPKAISQSNIDEAKSQFLTAQAALQEAKANYETAKINFDYTMIKAPIDGVVGNVELTRGDYISPSSKTLFTIVQYNPIRVVFSITDKEYLQNLAKVSQNNYKNEKIHLKLSDGSIYNKQGYIEYFDNRLDKSTGSLAVYAYFNNEEKHLITNAYVDVLLEKNFKNIVTINKKMVRLTPQGNFVSITNNGKISSKKVNIIASSDNNYIIANDFNKDDMLVLSNTQGLRPDQKIIIKPIAEKGE